MLAVLLGGAALVAVALGAGLVALGPGGVAGLAAMVAGSLSACVFFILELRKAPLSSLVLVALALLSLISFVRALTGYLRQQRLLAALPLEKLDDDRAAGLGPVYVAPATRPAAFCFGLRRPRVVVTAGLLARLDAEELQAALLHEAHHARAREPLKCLLARLAASTFFWLPALGALLERYLLVKELEADRVAAEATSRRALAGALYEVVGTPNPQTAVGLSDFASARVDRLFDAESPLPRLWTCKLASLSVIAVGAVALTAAFPARVAFSPPDGLGSMLTSMSLHGLPGMAAGLIVNVLVIGSATLGTRRLLRRRRRHERRVV